MVWVQFLLSRVWLVLSLFQLDHNPLMWTHISTTFQTHKINLYETNCIFRSDWDRRMAATPRWTYSFSNNPFLFINMCSCCWLIKPTFWNVKLRWFQQLEIGELGGFTWNGWRTRWYLQSKSKIFTLAISKQSIMAATPEELRGLIEPAPPSPSVLLDHPSPMVTHSFLRMI